MGGHADIRRPVLLKKKDSETQALGGPDPKVIEFLHILDEYRVKCEDEGNIWRPGARRSSSRR